MKLIASQAPVSDSLDQHFRRRVSILLDKAEKSGDYVEVTLEDFDSMEREALEVLRRCIKPT